MAHGRAQVGGPTFIGRPLHDWLFGLRAWTAMMLALYVAFWLQLDGASSSLITAAILALPTRGEVFNKALYRVAGTLIAFAASLFIAGLFSDTRTLFVVAVAVWLALCVFAANMLDGNRAYAAVLSGYTVAIIAVANIDSPQKIFTVGIDRVAAVLIGIASVALINDVFAAPGLLPGLLKRVEAAHAEVRAFGLRVVERGSVEAVAVAPLFGRVTALRVDALALQTDSVAGRARAAAARRAIAEMINEIRAARVLGATLSFAGEHGTEWRPRIAAALDDPDVASHLLQRTADVIADENASAPRLIAARASESVIRRDRLVADAVDDLASGRGPRSAPRLRTYHSPEGAGRNALRVLVAVLVSGALLVAAGLPSASTTLEFICVLAGLSANTPNPQAFLKGALIAIPIATVTAGITLFLILDGADSFPLLALALLPTVLVSGLLMTAGKPALLGLGFLLNVFTPLQMSLANPQKYNPATYLNVAIFVAVAALLLAAAVVTLLPTSDERRRGWMINSARRGLRRAVEGRRFRWLNTEEASFRAADRLSQFAALRYPEDETRRATLEHAMHLSEVTFSALSLRDALAGDESIVANEVRTALSTLDAPRLRAAGVLLKGDARQRWAGAGAVRVAALIEHYGEDLALAFEGSPS